MSCWTFGRRIEHACLRLLLEHFSVDAVTLDYRTTDRNAPLQAFLRELLGTAPTPSARIARTDFIAACPLLYHTIDDSQA